MELKAIKCLDGYFLETASKLQFGKERTVPTWKNGWTKVSQINQPVFTVIPARNETTGYKLKEGYIPSEVLPPKVELDFFPYEGENENIRGLYEPIFKEIPEALEPIEVDVQIVAEVEGELLEKKLEFPIIGRFKDDYNWKVTNQQIKVSLLDEITLPHILHQEVPCELSSEDSYKIIRSHIRQNIDPKVSRITSDYDFCLTVEKTVPLAETEEYTYDANNSFFSRKKKPKIVKGYRTDRKLTVYETAPRIKGTVYGKYTPTVGFNGANAEELQKNIEAYLEAIMTEINRPLKDCPTCKGQGVIEITNHQ